MADTCSGWAAPVVRWDRGICGTQALPQRTGLGARRRSPKVGGEVVLLSPQRPSPRPGRPGLAPVPLAAGRLASEVLASWGEALLALPIASL